MISSFWRPASLAVESRGDPTGGIPTTLASSRYGAGMSAVTFTRRTRARSSSSSSIWCVRRGLRCLVCDIGGEKSAKNLILVLRTS